MFYAVARCMARLLFGLVLRWRVTGVENMPRRGPLIVVANHCSWWDPVLLGAALTRPIHFMTKEELFRNRILAFILRLLRAFPVRRGWPDRRAVLEATKVIQDGGVLGLFPEGTRSVDGSLREAEPGAALLAMKHEVAVVPVGIVNSRGMFSVGRPFPKVEVRVGKAVRFEEGPGRGGSGSESVRLAGERIMHEIRGLLNSDRGGIGSGGANH